MSYKIAIADDHVLMREMLRKTLEEVADFKVVGEAGDGAELMDVIEKTAPDMVILDIMMPNMNGLSALRIIKRQSPAVKVLMLTMCKSRQHISRAFSEKADGYLLKENTFAELVSAVERIRSGRKYISDLLSEQMIHFLQQETPGEKPQQAKSLTEREREVLDLMLGGKSAKEIADSLVISLMTVYNHRNNIKKKLGAKKDIDLIRCAMEEGYIPNP